MVCIRPDTDCSGIANEPIDSESVPVVLGHLLIPVAFLDDKEVAWLNQNEEWYPSQSLWANSVLPSGMDGPFLVVYNRQEKS